MAVPSFDGTSANVTESVTRGPASPENDGVEITASDQGNRTTTSYVASTDTEPWAGDAAKDQVARNPEGTVLGAKRLTGREVADRIEARRLRLRGNHAMQLP